MALLFSYGTLQEARVQQSTFGRLLAGERDALSRYEVASIPIEDPEVIESTGNTHYANVVFNGRNDSIVNGTVFEITEKDLQAADEFERDAAYIRIVVTLASGKQAWVYLHASSGT